jgi:hypothetical protein
MTETSSLTVLSIETKVIRTTTELAAALTDLCCVIDDIAKLAISVMRFHKSDISVEWPSSCLSALLIPVSLVTESIADDSSSRSGRVVVLTLSTVTVCEEVLRTPI